VIFDQMCWMVQHHQGESNQGGIVGLMANGARHPNINHEGRMNGMMGNQIAVGHEGKTGPNEG